MSRTNAYRVLSKPFSVLCLLVGVGVTTAPGYQQEEKPQPIELVDHGSDIRRDLGIVTRLDNQGMLTPDQETVINAALAAILKIKGDSKGMVLDATNSECVPKTPPHGFAPMLSSSCRLQPAGEHFDALRIKDVVVSVCAVPYADKKESCNYLRGLLDVTIKSGSPALALNH